MTVFFYFKNECGFFRMAKRSRSIQYFAIHTNYGQKVSSSIDILRITVQQAGHRTVELQFDGALN